MTFICFMNLFVVLCIFLCVSLFVMLGFKQLNASCLVCAGGLLSPSSIEPETELIVFHPHWNHFASCPTIGLPCVVCKWVGNNLSSL